MLERLAEILGVKLGYVYIYISIHIHSISFLGSSKKDTFSESCTFKHVQG